MIVSEVYEVLTFKEFGQLNQLLDLPVHMLKVVCFSCTKATDKTKSQCIFF